MNEPKGLGRKLASRQGHPAREPECASGWDSGRRCAGCATGRVESSRNPPRKAAGQIRPEAPENRPSVGLFLHRHRRRAAATGRTSSRFSTNQLQLNQVGWDWVSLQLDDGKPTGQVFVSWGRFSLTAKVLKPTHDRGDSNKTVMVGNCSVQVLVPGRVVLAMPPAPISSRTSHWPNFVPAASAILPPFNRQEVALAYTH